MLLLLLACRAVDGAGKPDDTGSPGDTAPDTDTGTPDDTDTAVEDTDTDDTDDTAVEDTDTAVPDDTLCDGLDQDGDGQGAPGGFLADGRREYDDLQDAVDDATTEVLVCEGEWTATATVDHPLTIRSLQGGAEGTTLSGAGVSRILDASAALTLEDLTFRDGAADEGGAVYVNGAALTVERCVFEFNVALGSGGAVLVRDPDGPVVLDVVGMTGNEAGGNGGAIAIDSAGDVDLTLDRVELQANRANYGGAVLVTSGGDAAIRIDDAWFSATETLETGGVLLLADGDLDFVGTSSQIVGGTAESGAGLYLMADGEVAATLDGWSFENNAAESVGALYFGGVELDVTITGTTLTGNSAAGFGGAVMFAAHPAGGSVGMSNVRFDANIAVTVGGAIYAYGPLAITVTDSTFTSNSALSGGAITAWTSLLSVTNTDFGTDATDNTPDDIAGCATDYGAAASFVWDGSSCE